jgi:hypothetical protein
MNDFFHPPFIAIDGARPVDTLIGPHSIEQWRRQAQRRPAALADGAVQRMLEWLLARRARRLK